MSYPTSLVIQGLCIVLIYGVIGTQAKVFSGLVSSKDAWQDKGTFITKFCFHGTFSKHYKERNNYTTPLNVTTPLFICHLYIYAPPTNL